MHPPAYSLAQSHIEDLRRAAATSGLRAEARRHAAEGLSPRPAHRSPVVRLSVFRRLAARLAV